MTLRYTGACDVIAIVGVGEVIDWIAHIDLADWPQQNRPGEELRPAMSCDPEWFGFKAKTDLLVDEVMSHFPDCIADTRMLSVVRPGQGIAPHVDYQGEAWRCRVHIPLLTNPQSKFTIGDKDYNLVPGLAYKVNTLAKHSVTNHGLTNRTHLMFDVRLPC